MGEERVLGVDFGGTKIGLGIVAADGTIVSPTEVPSRVAEGGAVVRANLVEAVVDALRDEPAVTRIGVGFKGPIDSRRGLSLSLVGVGGMVHDWTDVPVAALLRDGVREQLGRAVEVWVENDATGAALGELWQGAARGATNWVFVICGTGIGAKFFENGRLLRGQGASGEFGHTIIDPSQSHLVCGCGSRSGHMEALASGQSLDQRARHLAEAEPGGRVAQLAAVEAHPIAGKHLVQAAREGDAGALRQLDEVRRYLGLGLANLVNLFDPELIVIGGGVATGTGGFVVDRAREIALAEALPSLARHTRIETTTLEREAGVLGAAYLALRAGDI